MILDILIFICEYLPLKKYLYDLDFQQILGYLFNLRQLYFFGHTGFEVQNDNFCTSAIALVINASSEYQISIECKF
jgi:hypothetical protein